MKPLASELNGDGTTAAKGQRSRYGCQDCGLYCGSDRSKREHHRCNVCQKVATVHYPNVTQLTRHEDGYFHCLTCDHRTTDSRRINTHSKICAQAKAAPSRAADATSSIPQNGNNKQRKSRKSGKSPTEFAVQSLPGARTVSDNSSSLPSKPSSQEVDNELRERSESSTSASRVTSNDSRLRPRKRKRDETSLSDQPLRNMAQSSSRIRRKTRREGNGREVGASPEGEDNGLEMVRPQPSFQVPKRVEESYTLKMDSLLVLTKWGHKHDDAISFALDLHAELSSRVGKFGDLQAKLDEANEPKRAKSPYPSPYELWRQKRLIMNYLSSNADKLKLACDEIMISEQVSNIILNDLEVLNGQGRLFLLSVKHAFVHHGLEQSTTSKRVA